MQLVRNCPICNSNSLKILYRYVFNKKKQQVYSNIGIFFKEFAKEKKSYVFLINLCRKCGFLFLNPRFTEEDYKKLFSSKGTLDNRQSIIINNVSKSVYYYNIIKKFYSLPIHRKNRNKPNILDFGGHLGYNLIPYLKNYNCYLIDYRKYDHPKGIKYLGRNSLVLEEKDIIFDIIISTHVLEHVNNPRHVIEILSQHLKENGLLYIEVPLGCFQEWKNLDTPFRHINYFSKQSLYNLFKLVNLKVLYLKISIKKIKGFTPHWNLDIIGTKSSLHMKQKKINIISTESQMKKFYYYIPLIIKKYGLKPIIISKLIEKLKKKIQIDK